ncbi:MAG TPA: TonB-dependent receptor [Vicinamibacterales bacterium]|nr:TonB-dependent receptor [Vicinamibacterales bacterium]
MPAPARAQAVTGALVGNVTDQSSLALPGATVIITETNTNISHTTTTNEGGYYTFPSLKDGTYKVVAELAGFKKVLRDGVIVNVNTTIRVDLKLEVGAIEESITVKGESPVLQTDRSDTGRLIESKMVTDLPLSFNRNFQSLLITVPGATRPHREHSAFFNSQDSLSTEVNGQSRLANNTMIEGVDDNQKTGLLQVIIPAADALETVSVTTSNYDAEFGRSGGAITNVTLKSGTNTLKGTGFSFFNNEKTNAGDYFSHLKAPTKFLNAGFTLGGPIVRNKVFFFGDYQRTIDNFGYIVRTTVPTVAMRNGDFSAVTQHIYDPLTGDITGANRVAFPNNQIPADRISPIAKQLLAFVPLPNIQAALGQNNFQQAQVRKKTTDGFDAKVNYTMSDKDQMSYRVSFMRPVVFDPGLFGQFGGPANGGFAGRGTNNSASTAATWTRVFSKSTLLDVRGGLNYYRNITSTTGDGLTTSKDIGIPGANLDQFTSGISNISIGGYGDPLLGFAASQPWDRWEKTWNVVTSLTKLMEKHTVKFGGEWRKNTDMLLQTQDAGGSRGRFAFNANGTGNPAEPGSTGGIANPLASFLLDWPSTVQRDLKVIDQPGTRHWAVASFIQDKWQVRSNVTLDLGLRWEYYKPLQGIEGKGTLANYDPLTNQIQVAGYGSFSNSLNVKNYYKNFAPRTGMSWRLNDLTVVRAGYGASAIPFPDNRFAFAFPVKQNYSGTAANGFQAQGSMAAGFPAPVLASIPATGIITPTGTLLNSTYDVIPTGLHEAKLHSWNVAFQRQLPFSFSADIAYVGSRGVGLIMDVDENASVVYGSGNAGRPQFAPFNRTGQSRARTNLGKSQYHGLQMKVDRRFTNGLLVTNSYTLGRSMDLAQENTGIGTPIDFNLSWARSDTDRLHNWVTSAVYELPWGPRRKWMSDSTLGKIVGGWQLSGLFIAQSGQALTIGGNGTILNTPGNSAFVDLNGQNTVLGNLGPGLLYFDPKVYSLPAAGVQGNMKRHSGPDGPGFWQLDSSLFKRFALGGSRYGEFRVDAYNVTNSVRWGNPNTAFSIANGNTFGQITGTTGSQRSIRFGARFAF